MVTIDRSDGVVLVWLKHLPPVQGMGDKAEEHIRGRILAADDTLVRLEVSRTRQRCSRRHPMVECGVG